MALVEDSCGGGKENLAKASVLAQNSEYYSSSSPWRRGFWNCGEWWGFHLFQRHHRPRCCCYPTMTTPTVALCWSRPASFSLEFGCSTSPRLSHLYHGWWSGCTPSSDSRADCLWRLYLEHQKCLCGRNLWNICDAWRRQILVPKCGSVTVTELLDPVCSDASLCTSTLAGLKSSERKKLDKLKVKMWQILQN